MATSKITLGAGCFWCVETSFRRLKGVISAISGYSGGHKVNPTYKEVSFSNLFQLQNLKLIFNSQTRCAVRAQAMLRLFKLNTIHL